VKLARAAASARRSEELYRALVETTNTGYAVLDDQCRVLDANGEYVRLTGHNSLKEILGRSVLEWTAGYESKKSEQSAAKCAKDGHIRNLEIDYADRNGNITPVEINATATRAGDSRRVLMLCRDITARCAAENRLRYFQKAVEHSTDAIGMATPQGRHYYQNEAFTRLFGRTVEQTEGESGPPSTVFVDEKIGREVFIAVNGGGVWSGEVKMFRSDNSVIDVLLRAYSMKDESGKVIGTVGVHTDITERKIAEAAVAAERERLAVTLRSIGDAVISTDTEGRITMMNKVAERLTGWSERAALGRPLPEVFSPVSGKTLAKCPNPVVRVLDTGGAAELAGNALLISLAGGRADIADSAAPILDASGKMLGAVLVFRDVTEERRRQDINEKFRDISEMTSDMLWETDDRALYSYASQRCRDILGYEPEELLGKSPFDFMPQEEAARVMPVFGGYAARRQPFTLLEAVHRRKDGVLVTLETNGVPVFDGEGRLRGYRGVDRDITERRRKDEALRLLEVEKQASDAASRAKTAFLANMSHELRTPLNAVIVSADVLEQEMFGGLNDKQREYVGNVLFGGRHLLTLVNDILDMSKIEADKLELSFSRVRVRDIVESSGAMMRGQAAQAGINFFEDIAVPEDAAVFADERRLRQIVLNLLSNAIKFTPQGGSVSIKAELAEPSAFGGGWMSDIASASPGAGKFLVVTVRDTGIGVRPQDTDKLFKPFSQVDAERPGTGLGLALVKKLAELHKGAVRFESEAGKGSAFSFAIPAESA